MNPLYEAEKSGFLAFYPVRKVIPGLNEHYTHLSHYGAFGEINLYIFKGLLLEIEFSIFNPVVDDTVHFPEGIFAYTFVAAFLDSFYLSVPGEKPILFHDRGFNIVDASVGCSINFKKDHRYLIVMVRYTHSFILNQFEINPGGKYYFMDPFRGRLLYFNRQGIVTKQVMDILNQFLFDKSVRGYGAFYVEEAATYLFQFVTEQSSALSFQSPAIDLEEAELFYAQKNRLLEFKSLPIGFKELLDKSGIANQRRFRDRMKQLYGLNIQQFITEARVVESALLLRNPKLPMKQIARDLGFKTVYYFSRVFNNYYGESPGAYRKRNRD